MAIGSPGADRITTAMHQVLVNALQFGMPLTEAIAHPRVHVDTTGVNDRVCAEPGLDLPALGLSLQAFAEVNMYFGGVSVATFDRDSGFQVAADPRREGGVFLSDA
jgi:gamma-glutamyltranspeptidase/glutathione hydrolase